MTRKAGILYQKPLFQSSAVCAERFLKCKGFLVSSSPFKSLSTLDNIPRFPGMVDFMVWYSHGGWDGPLVFGFEEASTPSDIPFQISPDEPEEWVQLMTYFKLQLTERGMFVAHSCHSAGSDWREKKIDQKMGYVEKNWIRDIAKHMNVYAVGEAGSAGAANIPTVKLLLEFAFTGRAQGYPFRAYAPGGARLTKPSEWPRL